MYWTIANVNYAGTPKEPNDNWAGELLSQWNNAGTHNSDNYIFVSEPKDYVGLVYQIDDIEVETDDINTIVITVAKWMLEEDRSIPILGTASQFQRLHEHPIWKVWCDNYEEGSEERKSNYLAIGLTDYKSNLTTETIRDRLKALLTK